ncbi:ion transporter [Comamonas aquatica]|uniref:ion transporter n=1 Tax=Comamonas aquatica TaxID=225991 RepID=UPI001B384EA5|nr:ion transporter [Comamonas aquatica]QTX22564.1 ion transporter [Comamonas aquatica]
MTNFDKWIDRFSQRYPSAERLGVPVAKWRKSIYVTIFESNTKLGRNFDRILTILIALSLLVLIFHSVPSVQKSSFENLLSGLEWFFTIIFTAEYILRIISVRKPVGYIFSFYGVVDFLSIIPAYLSIFYPDAHYLSAIRALRLIRTFHVFPLLKGFMEDYLFLGRALKSSARKIFVFLSVVAVIVFVMGTLIYIIEGPENGFTSVPVGIYWAISTVTTVGYGDITPSTGAGRFFASIMMLIGWGILAVPTGLVGAEFYRNMSYRPDGMKYECDKCHEKLHDKDANFCKICGNEIIKK